MELFSSTIFDQLKKEHEAVKGLLKEAQKCPVSDRRDVLQKIEKELVPHARGEEKTLYALMLECIRENKSGSDFLTVTNEAYEEHKVVDGLLGEIKLCKVTDERWPALMKVIKENLEHHIQEEENELFPKAKKILSEDQLSRVLEAYNHAKEEYKRNLPKQTQIDERRPSAELRDSI